MIEIEIIELGFMPLMGGWIGTAISVGASLFGGMSARRKARRRKRKMEAAIDDKKDLLKEQIPGIENYYNNLDDMLVADFDVDLSRGIEDFATGVFNFQSQGDDLISAGKGLISGVTAKKISDTKDTLGRDTSRNIDDLFANYDKTSLQLSNARNKELTAIDMALEDLDIQLASLG
tara:strand:+ start:347 stop:874 length:528 start_codon:yes stop_codon:yes gene_type:complete